MSLPLSQLIRTRRQAARLSRARLADRARISESTLKNLEAGRLWDQETGNMILALFRRR